MADRAFPDQNNNFSLFAVSNADGVTPVSLWADPATHLLQVSGGGSSGGTQYQELATTSPATGTLALGRYQTTLPTLTNGQMNEPMLDSASRLLVNAPTATGSTAPSNAFMAGMQSLNSGNLIALRSSAGDATGSDFLLSTHAEVWNGSNYDRTRSASAASNTTGTGLLGVGNLGFDGTNWQSIGAVVGDTGFNSMPVSSGTKTINFTTSTAGAQTILANTSVEGYSWIEVVYTSVGVGLALTGQFSTASGGTYVSSSTFGNSNNTAAGPLPVTSGIIYFSPTHGNFFQIAVSALTSGTFAGTITLRAMPPPALTTYSAQTGTWTVGSNSATGSAVPANVFAIGMQSGTNTLVPVNSSSLIGDNSANGALATANYNYNNTSVDRQRNNTLVVAQASGTTATSSNTVTTYNARSAVIIINVSAYTSGTMNIAINLLSSSGYSYSPFTSITGLAATGTVVYRIGPGLTPSAGLTANDVLGRSLQIVTSGTFSLTYGIDVNLEV